MRLSLNGQAHIDHRPPNTFDAIVAEFEIAEGITDHENLLAAHLDNDLEDRVADPGLVARFRTFHRDRAELDFVSKKVNLKRLYQNRQQRAQIVLRDYLREQLL